MHNVALAKRKTWDLGEYREKAQQREQEKSGGKPTRVIWTLLVSHLLGEVPPEKREYLQAREKALNFDTSVGQVKVLLQCKLQETDFFQLFKGTVDSAKNLGGFHCDVCDCVLKDSVAFTAHINGKLRPFWIFVMFLTHPDQRMIGRKMRSKQVTLSDVKARIKENKRKKEEEVYDFDSRVQQLREEDEREAKRRKQERLDRKNDGRAADTKTKHEETREAEPVENAEAEEEEEEDEEMAQMAAMFGLPIGFGGSKKN